MFESNIPHSEFTAGQNVASFSHKNLAEITKLRALYLVPRIPTADMTEANVARETAIASAVILALISILFGISLLISTLLGLPSSLRLPIAVRILGAAMVATALAVVGWLFRVQKPWNHDRIHLHNFLQIVQKRTDHRACRTNRITNLQRSAEVSEAPALLWSHGYGIWLGAGDCHNIRPDRIRSHVDLVSVCPDSIRRKRVVRPLRRSVQEIQRNTPMLVPFTKHKRRANTTS